MSQSQRITLSLPADLVASARAVSGGNLSRFVASVLRRNLERLRRQELRKALTAGYAAEADLDLAICEECRHVDRETAEHAEPEP
jgi:metal-responsive CopG/Arc/MetJ family transcriptional regulator